MKIFGIRHHGPGSAKRLRTALRDLKPDCILVELPADVSDALKYVGNQGLRPPVTLLVYNPKDLGQASYLPFAEFSPEWQALRYGAAQGLPVWPIDLPLGQLFSLGTAGGGQQLLLSDPDDREGERIQTDPLGFLAELAGYSDSERWWEVTFEQEESETALFDAILDMVRTLRTELGREESEETLLREAHMRKMIRQARQAGFRRVAVVCGAWHAPALADVDRIKPTHDNQRLRGLKKIRTNVTWIPWSYERLARRGGYQAGVTSPAWYDMLFRQGAEVTIRWMSRAARLFRREDQDASSAHAVEAVRLAETLATLRHRSLPGLEELEEAAAAVFCHGDEARMALLHDKLSIGDVMGRVPVEIPVVPLQRDLEQRIRSARLTKESQTTESIRKTLDLRKDSNRLASLLLHRLNILGISWGRLRRGPAFKTGSFREDWTLKWKPDFAIRLIEASAWGSTVAEAAGVALVRRGDEEDNLAGLALLVEEALRADLQEAVDPLILRMRMQAALATDVVHLIAALPSMILLVIYGDTRKTDTEAVGQLVDELVPRLCIGLPGAALSLEEDVARELFQQILGVHRAINLLNQSNHNDSWQSTLRQLLTLPRVNELIRGGATRLLFDRGDLSAGEARNNLYQALSSGNSAADATAWLEGFLHGNGLLLVHHPMLWTIIDEWVDQLDTGKFQATLPLLRRIFAQFTPAERRQMLALAHRAPQAIQPAGPEDFDEERAKRVLPTVWHLLQKDGPSE